MLTVENLECGYGKLPVLRKVSITIGDESVGLFGPNGAGKTTLINAIMGIVRPRAGRLESDGRDLSSLKTHEIARAGHRPGAAGTRAFSLACRWPTTCELGAAYIPHAKDIVEKQLGVVMELFPILKERYRQLAGTMSGGQQRMVAIARALMANPRLLILDEPSLGLQPSIVSEVFETLARLKATVSILVTEQNVRESLRAVDRGYVLENGAVALRTAPPVLPTTRT